MNIIWSATAEKTYLLVIEQILERWTVKEARRFMADVDRLEFLLFLHFSSYILTHVAGKTSNTFLG